MKRCTVTVAIVSGLMVWAFADSSRADEATDKLIEEIVARGRTNAQRASGLFEAGNLATENATLQTALLEKAVEYALKSSMTDQMRSLLEKSLAQLVKIAPDRADTWRARQIDLYTRWYRLTRGRPERPEIGQKLLDLLLAAATVHEQAARWPDAVVALRQAASIASTLKLPEKAGISARVRLGLHRHDVARRVVRYAELLKSGKATPAMRRMMVTNIVIDLDNPKQAVEYLNDDIDQGFRGHVSLAVQDVESTEEGACGKLGKWYYEQLRPKALSVSKPIMLARAAVYYRRFVELHAAQDVAGLKAKTALAKIEKELERLPVGLLPGIRDRQVFAAAKSMKPCALGTSFPPFPVQVTKSAIGPFTGKGVYFDQKSGKDVVYEVFSGRRVAEVYFKGAGVFQITIEILDPKGKLVATIGPLSAGNQWAQITLKVPAEVGHHFLLRFRNHASNWFYIDIVTLKH